LHATGSPDAITGGAKTTLLKVWSEARQEEPGRDEQKEWDRRTGGRRWTCVTKQVRNEAPHAHTGQTGYNKPDARKCVTGSLAGTGSRLKIQRATAKPIAT
jgi:hypothetical protein